MKIYKFLLATTLILTVLVLQYAFAEQQVAQTSTKIAYGESIKKKIKGEPVGEQAPDLPPGFTKNPPPKKTDDKATKKAIKDDEITESKPFYSKLEELTPERREELKKVYKDVTKSDNIYVALELLKDTVGNFSRTAIMGENLTEKPIKVEYKDLSTIAQQYESFDALGWKKGSKLYIYINQKHADAPAAALAALLAHEALHQDQFNSINEETYAWTMEAAVWMELTEQFPELQEAYHPLVMRENMLKKLFIRGNYTDKYIRKTVTQNPGYKNLPSRSPGFDSIEDI